MVCECKPLYLGVLYKTYPRRRDIKVYCYYSAEKLTKINFIHYCLRCIKTY